jgi:hypothetical protein
MIETINTGLSHYTNKRIINLLYTSRAWSLGIDDKFSDNYDQLIDDFDTGFILPSYEKEQKNFGQTALNIYAEIICDILYNKSKIIKFKTIDRFYWNWYNQTSVTEYHQDRKESNKYSIVYNIHNNDGGTEIKINNEINFYKSNIGEAVLFPSNLWHKGIAPKKNKQRFSLNIIVEI